MPASYVQPDALLPRPRLEAALDGALTRRLTSLVGGAGTGKTTLLTQWSGRKTVAWHTVMTGDPSLSVLARGILDALRLQVPDLSPDLFLAIEGGRGPDSGTTEPARADALAAELSRDLQTRLGKDVVLVLDDLHHLAASGEGARLVAALCRNAPDRLHLITASREPLPFPASRMRIQGQATEITAEELAFGEDEVLLLLGGGARRDHARAVFERTGGWPVAVALARRLSGRDIAAGGSWTTESDARLFEFLAEEVIATESPGSLLALRVASVLPWLTTKLAEDLGIADSALRLFEPASRSVFANRAPNRPDAVALSPLVRDFVVARYPLEPEERSEVLTMAAAWYEEQASHREALDCLVAMASPDAIAGFVARRGETMLSAGMARRLLAAIETIPSSQRDESVLLCEAEARQMLGDWEGASTCYEAMAAGSGEIPARLAWRLGFLSHMRGDVTGALAIYSRGRLDDGDLANEAALLGWTASAHWLRGEREDAKNLANEALARARRSNDSRALATAHTVLAMVAALDGDRAGNDIHYLRALEHAEKGRDVIQAIRIRSNRGSHFLEEGDYDNALAELDIALRLADMTGFQLWRAMSLSNRAQVLGSRGRLEEAVADLEQSREIFRRMGSSLESYPLAQMGDVYQSRGEGALARAAYEEAIRLAEEAPDLQGLVPALSGLSRVMVAVNPGEAALLADRASEVPSVIGHVRAVLAQGHAALAAGDVETALGLAHTAADIARSRQDLPGLAEAMELEASAEMDPARARDLLSQARQIWVEIDAPLGAARVDIALIPLSDPVIGRQLAESTAASLRVLGAKGLAMDADSAGRRLTELTTPEVAIRTLGGFGVLVSGVQVPVSAWQSRVAREILAMLAISRGRSLHREVVIERLWPDEDLAKAANRLSVALSTIRGVLDPGRRHDPNRYLMADRDSLRLDERNVEVDVDAFFEAADRGRALLRGGSTEQGLALLRAAEARYVGELLEDQPYAEWAIGIREEARSEFISMAAMLAEADIVADDHDGAARWSLRILEQDPYNEPAHLSLVRSMMAVGRHGTARRLYGVYVARMSELDVEPEAFPAKG